MADDGGFMDSDFLNELLDKLPESITIKPEGWIGEILKTLFDKAGMNFQHYIDDGKLTKEEIMAIAGELGGKIGIFPERTDKLAADGLSGEYNTRAPGGPVQSDTTQKRPTEPAPAQTLSLDY